MPHVVMIRKYWSTVTYFSDIFDFGEWSCPVKLLAIADNLDAGFLHPSEFPFEAGWEAIFLSKFGTLLYWLSPFSTEAA